MGSCLCSEEQEKKIEDNENESEHKGPAPSMTLIGAVYGFKDVTEIVRKYIKNDKLTIDVTYGVLGYEVEPKHNMKVLTVVYTYGKNVFQVAHSLEHTRLSINYESTWPQYSVSITDGQLTIFRCSIWHT